MTTMKDLIERRIKYLETTCQTKAQDLANAPAGNIRIKKRGKSTVYCRVTPDTGPNGIYLRKADVATVKALVQKEYDNRIIQYAQKEISILKKLAIFYEIAQSTTSIGATAPHGCG